MARNPDVKCVTITLPGDLVEAIDRQSAKHSGVVNRSHLIRECLVPEMLKTDETFAKKWHQKWRG